MSSRVLKENSQSIKCALLHTHNSVAGSLQRVVQLSHEQVPEHLSHPRRRAPVPLPIPRMALSLVRSLFATLFLLFFRFLFVSLPVSHTVALTHVLFFSASASASLFHSERDTGQSKKINEEQPEGMLRTLESDREGIETI